MSGILVASAIFTGLIMLLVLIVLGARGLLLAGGVAHLRVNGGEVINGEMGDTLLDMLDEAGMRLPTSCGGKGTCGLCRIKIVDGAGLDSILPVERVTLSETQLAQGYRLACQLLVSGDLDVEVPPELLGGKNWQCTVLETRSLAPLIKEIVLALPENESQEFPAGCYVIVVAPPFDLDYAEIEIAPEYEAEWQRMGLRELRAGSSVQQSRAYSLVNRPGDTQRLVLNIRLALPPAAHPRLPPGVVSSYLFGLKPGDAVTASGHYGDFFIRETDREIVFIGGGVGMAPFYAHAHDQLEHMQSQRTISFWYGARALQDLYYVDEMEKLAREHANFSWHVALSEPGADDAWTGPRGLIHEVIFEQYLGHHPAPGNCEYYLCGPPLMIAAVRAMLDRLQVPSENIFNDDFGL
jgi:Na+-transporting NADH:ubiquinone oxidoreductase subunit F